MENINEKQEQAALEARKWDQWLAERLERVERQEEWERKERQNEPIRCVCIICGKTLLHGEEAAGLAQCHSCMNPKIIQPTIVRRHNRDWLRTVERNGSVTMAPLEAVE